MAYRIATELIEQILAEAAASPGVEVCGLLMGEGEVVEEARPCRNVAADPARSFEIDPAALIAAHRAEREGRAAILGCYHSHPRGDTKPSLRDAADAAPSGWLWLIVAGDEVRGWRAKTPGSLHGRFDEVLVVI